MVKIPGTEEGLGPIEQMIAEGRSINVTLIFSLPRYSEVIEAYIRGLERLAEDADADLSRVASVASFFISRVDSEVDHRLDAIGTDDALALRGKAAVAQGKLAYQLFLEAFSGPRWDALAGRGARVQRPLWASTSTKNPDTRDVLYVEELLGPDTVTTRPRETIEAVQDHGEVRGDSVLEDVAAAARLLDELREAGIDYDDVVETLEAEGVQKFADSFVELLEGIRAKQVELAAARPGGADDRAAAARRTHLGP
jgi:transaldolase